ncbi:MAG: type II toxin-antitoxin system VapC family toxin [bacterium]
MKDYVIDTSVAVKWFIVQPFYEQAIEILDLFEQNKCRLHAPSTIYLEFTNVLWKYRTFFSLSEIQNILAKFLKFDLIVHEHTHLLKGALNIAIEYKRSVYDSIFIFLAKEIEADFITSDEKLVNAVSKELNFVKLLQDIKI